MCDLDIMLRGIEARTDPTDHLTVHDDRKTALHLNEITRGDSRGPAVIDRVFQRLARLFEESSSARFSWGQFHARDEGGMIHSQHQDRPPSIVDDRNDTS